MANSESGMVQWILQMFALWERNVLYPERKYKLQVRNMSLWEMVRGMGHTEKQLKEHIKGLEDHIYVLERSLESAENDCLYLADEVQRARQEAEQVKIDNNILNAENTMLRKAVMKKVGWEND